MSLNTIVQDLLELTDSAIAALSAEEPDVDELMTELDITLLKKVQHAQVVLTAASQLLEVHGRVTADGGGAERLAAIRAMLERMRSEVGGD